jgi:TnpA family transposase
LNTSPIKNSGHLRILSDTEINDLYELPQLTKDEMSLLFELNVSESAILTSGLSMERKIDAIIQLGFFRKKKRFFDFTFADVTAEVGYIVALYFDKGKSLRTEIGRNAHNQNRQWVLEMTGYTSYRKGKHLQPLLDKALELCRISSDPILIFRELLGFLSRGKISLPGYTTLQIRVIARALSLEQQRVAGLLQKQMSDSDREVLLSLLNQPETGFYAVTWLKQQPKNFSATAIRREVAWHEKYLLIYSMAKRIIPLLGISRNAVNYYAGLVEHFNVTSMNRANPDKTCCWLLCFMHNRYHRMMDNLATMFIFTASKYENDVEIRAKDLLLADGQEPDERNQKVASLLKIFVDPSVKNNKTFGKIRKEVFATIMPASEIKQTAEDMLDGEFQNKRLAKLSWLAVDEYADTYLPLLRILMKTLTVQGDGCKSLQQAFCFLQEHALKQNLSKIVHDKFPIKFIEKDRATAILNEQRVIHTRRYEFECYRLIAKRLNGRAISLENSICFASLQSSLLPNWEKEKKSVIKKLNKPLLTLPFSEFIFEKAKPLDEKIIRINEDIRSGKIDHVKIKVQKDGTEKWTLPYAKKQTELNNPFYEMLPKVGIIEVLLFVDKCIGFMNAFTHIKPHYSKSRLDELSLYACILANGTNLGIGKMSALCDMNLQQLITTEKNFLRLSTVRTANDILCNAISRLPIFRHWNLQPDILHASLDGQKFITEMESLIARYSAKYLGLDKGAVAYSMIANHIPINTTIIGANEHESRFLFDLIYNNTSEILPDIFSTDTEGSNKLNFLLLHLIEKLYAPRYRTLPEQVKSIISYSDHKKFDGMLIKPCRSLNEKLILSEEDNVRHIMASLLAGETRQSNIVTQLSSGQFASKTKRAMWEMNAVLMTEHLLNFIDCLPFRQSIQGSLGRGEAYHQLRRHIERVNGHHFRGTSEKELLVWNECARFLANSLLYYNAVMLNKWLERCEGRGELQKCEFIKRLSPVAWTHVNFHGIFEFLTAPETIDIDAWLDKLCITEADFVKFGEE